MRFLQLWGRDDLQDSILGTYHDTHARTGRPEGTGTFRDAAHFETVMVAAIRAVGRRQRATQPAVAAYLSHDAAPGYPVCDDKQINRWCRSFKRPWALLLARAAE